MFITEMRYLSPLTSLECDPDQQSWTMCELSIDRPWFLVALVQADEKDADLLIRRTFFTSSVDQVEAWAKMNPNGALLFESASVVTPSAINGTGNWQMDRITSLGIADEPTDPPGYRLNVCETHSGEKYVLSFSATSADKLVNYKLRCQFPA